MKLRKINQLVEANLTIQDLDKRGRDGLRGDVLIKKIKDFDPVVISKPGEAPKDVVIVNGEDEILPEITIDGTGRYDSDGGNDYFKTGNRYSDVIEGDDEEYYKLNDIQKTAEFGSSKGSSLGTTATREIESLQCLVLSYRQIKKRQVVDFDYHVLDVSTEIEFDKYLKNVDTEANITKEVLRRYVPEWGATFLKTSNALYDKRTKVVRYGEKSDYLLKKKLEYKFYQISSNNGVSLAIKEAFRRCEQSANISKWNPADIWAVCKKSEQTIIEELNRCNNIKNLNHIVDMRFDSRELVGISLKKVTKWEEITMIINKVTMPPKYTFVGVVLSEDPLSTSSLRISVDRKNSFPFKDAIEYMTMRSFAGSKVQNISGEIAGKSARQGKISLTKINKILEKYNIMDEEGYLEQVPTTKEISKWSDSKLKMEVSIINRNIITRYEKSSPMNRSFEVNRARLTSKYQSLYLAWILMDLDDNRNPLVNNIVEEMFHYAMSIKYDRERTPKYVRVIDNQS